MSGKSVGLLFAGSLLVSGAQAVEVTGKVTDKAGEPIASVMVSVDNGAVQTGDVTISVFTDDQGVYKISDLSTTEGMTIRATLAGFVGTAEVTALNEATDGNVTQNLTLDNGMDEDKLPASIWMSKMPSEHGRELTLLQCGSCHQVPSKKMRGFAENLASLSEQDRVASWKAMIQYMRIKVFEIGPDGSKVSPEYVDFETMMDPEGSLFNLYDEGVISAYLGKHMPGQCRFASTSKASYAKYTRIRSIDRIN